MSVQRNELTRRDGSTHRGVTVTQDPRVYMRSGGESISTMAAYMQTKKLSEPSNTCQINLKHIQYYMI